MRRSWSTPFEEWLMAVNLLTRARHYMTIYELEDDVPRDELERAHAAGVAPESFVDRRVTPIFFPEQRARS